MGARSSEKKSSNIGLVTLGAILVVSALSAGVYFTGVIHVIKHATQFEPTHVNALEGTDVTPDEKNSSTPVENANTTAVKIERPSSASIPNVSVDPIIQDCDTQVFCSII
jgi:hypothetical protein